MYREPMLPVMREVEPAVFFDCSVNPINRTVKTAEWTHSSRAIFGESRPCGFGGTTTKWTGDSYRYDIFTKGREIALRWWNGAGEGWFVYNDSAESGEVSLLWMIAAMENENRRWDACHFVWQTADRLSRWKVRETAAEYQQAFYDGRLKKRKRNGKVFVEILPKPGVNPLVIKVADIIGA